MRTLSCAKGKAKKTTTTTTTPQTADGGTTAGGVMVAVVGKRENSRHITNLLLPWRNSFKAMNFGREGADGGEIGKVFPLFFLAFFRFLSKSRRPKAVAAAEQEKLRPFVVVVVPRPARYSSGESYFKQNPPLPLASTYVRSSAQLTGLPGFGAQKNSRTRLK